LETSIIINLDHVLLGIYNPYAKCTILSINNDILETFETTAVENEIKERIAQGEVQGSEVEYWKVLDRIKIVRIKG
jgi:hypothetical protein